MVIDDVAGTDDGRAFQILGAAELTPEPTGPVACLPVLGREGFIVRGWCHVLAAHPKSGKTELMARLVRAWESDRALYLSEEPVDAWRERMRRLGGSWDHVRVGFALGAGPAAVRSAIEGSDATVVVIDTIRTLLGLTDENDNGAVAAALVPLIRAARARGVTLILVHHSRKAGGLWGVGVAGAHSLVALVDVVLELGRVPGVPRRRTISGLARVHTVPTLVYEQEDDLTFTPLGDPARLATLALRERIKEALDFDPISIKDLRDQMDPPRPGQTCLRASLNALVADGEVLRHPPHGGRGRRCEYYLPGGPTFEERMRMLAETPILL